MYVTHHKLFHRSTTQLMDMEEYTPLAAETIMPLSGRKTRVKQLHRWKTQCLRSRTFRCLGCAIVIISPVLALVLSSGDLTVKELWDVNAPQYMRSYCAMGKENLIQEDGYAFGELTKNWYSSKCQNIRAGCNQSPHIIDRTCTFEDEHINSGVFHSHVNSVLVSNKYRTVYVQNPSKAHNTVRRVMLDKLGAVEMSSTEISPQMFRAYFFFSFIEPDVRERFIQQAVLIMAKNRTLDQNCSHVAPVFTRMLTFWKNGDNEFVHSQLYQLSPDSGISNKMIRLDWIESSEKLKGGIIDVLLKIQERSLLCIPAVNFNALSSQLYSDEQSAYKTTNALAQCETPEIKALMAEMYSDDQTCIRG